METSTVQAHSNKLLAVNELLRAVQNLNETVAMDVDTHPEAVLLALSEISDLVAEAVKAVSTDLPRVITRK